MIGGRKNLIELAILGPDTTNYTPEQHADLQRYYDRIAQMHPAAPTVEDAEAWLAANPVPSK